MRQLPRCGVVVPQVSEDAEQIAPDEGDHRGALVRRYGNVDRLWCEKHKLDDRAHKESNGTAAARVVRAVPATTGPKGTRTLGNTDM